MKENKLFDIGSSENPVFVPSDALNPETDEGREYWEGIATGSVVLPDESLDLLLKMTNENKS